MQVAGDRLEAGLAPRRRAGPVGEHEHDKAAGLCAVCATLFQEKADSFCVDSSLLALMPAAMQLGFWHLEASSFLLPP